MQMKGREPEHVKHAARLAGAPLQTAGTDLSARPSSWKLHGVRGLHHQLELQCSVGLASVHCSAQQAAGSQPHPNTKPIPSAANKSKLLLRLTSQSATRLQGWRSRQPAPEARATGGRRRCTKPRPTGPLRRR